VTATTWPNNRSAVSGIHRALTQLLPHETAAHFLLSRIFVSLLADAYLIRITVYVKNGVLKLRNTNDPQDYYTSV
jgi:hypothetical protein